MKPKTFQYLFDRIIRRAAPLASASAVSLAMAGCDCPTTTSEEALLTATLGGEQWAEVLEQADEQGMLPQTACGELCADLVYNWSMLISCQVVESEPHVPSAQDDVVAESDVADSTQESDAGGGAESATDTATAADTGPSGVVQCNVEVTRSCEGVGRRPAGLRIRPSSSTAGAVGRYFAEASAQEMAAAVEFRRVAAELDGLGAPEELVAQARNHAVEEIRHAVLVGALAQRFGATPYAPVIPQATPRSLEEIAIHNAAEGCVEETFGALFVAWQAQQATDPLIGGVLRVIAREEAVHAEWSWRLHQWACSQLAADAVQRVMQSQCNAVHELRERQYANRDSELLSVAGLPGRAVCMRFVEELSAHMWG